jgi:hypothetical protein
MTAIDAHSAPANSKSISIETILLLLVLLAVAAWGASVFFFGIPGLYIPALALVPVMFVVLILISRG